MASITRTKSIDPQDIRDMEAANAVSSLISLLLNLVPSIQCDRDPSWDGGFLIRGANDLPITDEDVICYVLDHLPQLPDPN